MIYHDGMFIFGGDSGPNSGRLNDLFRFDLKTRKWTSVVQIGEIPKKRCGHSAVVFRDSMFVYGKFIEVSNIFLVELFYGIFSNVEVFGSSD